MGNKLSKNKKNKNNLSDEKNYVNKERSNTKENSIAYMTYKIDEKYEIRLFGKTFVETNKNKCKMLINEKECEIVDEIKVSKLKKYGIKKKYEEFHVILESKVLENISEMFYYCENLVKVDLSSFNTQNVTNM